MQISKLVKMANQIAVNFDYGNRDKAVAATADHMSRFWTPDMLAEIIDHSKSDHSKSEHSKSEHAKSGQSGLNEIAADAVAEIARSRSDAA